MLNRVWNLIKICGEVEAQVPESKYLHLAPEDIKKMNDALAEGWGFFNRTQSALKGVEKHQVLPWSLPNIWSLSIVQDASVTSFDIESKSNYIENLCKPIASKKPPKVEPPKEEEKKEEAPAAEEKKEEVKWKYLDWFYSISLENGGRSSTR